jgi:hypothetical protein
MEPTIPVSDREFVAELRQTVEAYFRAIDDWEAAYRKYYRLPDPRGKTPTDLSEQQAAYDSARAHFGAMIPRARGLSFRHGLRDPWTGLMRSPLGQSTPQDRYTSAISRSERTQAIECLLELAEAYAELAPLAPLEKAPAPPARSLWRRLLDFFY